MERYEVGDNERLTSLIDAARRGEEAVFTRDGAVIASVQPKLVFDDRPASGPIDLAKLRALHASLPPGLAGGGGDLIREMRDLDQH